MDKTGANFDYSIGTMRDRLGAKVAAIHVPIGEESTFNGFVDVVEMKAYIFDHAAEEKYTVTEVPANLQAKAEATRAELIDTIAEFDEGFMMKVLEGKEVTIDEIDAAIRAGVVSAQFHPVLCGTAYKNVGVTKLLDAVVKYLPSPLDVPAIEGTLMDGETLVTRKADDNEPFSALAFKIMTDPFVGKLTFFRVYSGTLEAGSYIMNTTKDKKERVGRIVQMHANDRTEIPSVVAGDIAAAIGLKSTTTGDTLTGLDNLVILESMVFPEPVISLAVEPKTKADMDKLSTALGKLSEEDPTFRTHMDTETGQTIIAGMGELHLEIIVDRLKREFSVDANVGAPQVSYRETLTKPMDVEHKHSKQTGGKGQYGHVKVKFTPNEQGKGFEFIDKITGGRIPKEYINSIRTGFEESFAGGILAGFPVIDVVAELYDGSYHDVDSSEMAFKLAASKAAKKTRDGLVLLEPIMDVEVTTPAEYFGDIMGDISSRRGMIQGQEERGNAQVVRANVPLAEMFGYSTKLRSMSQGRAVYTMQFKHYDAAPRNVAETVIKARGHVNVEDDD